MLAKYTKAILGSPRANCSAWPQQQTWNCCPYNAWIHNAWYFDVTFKNYEEFISNSSWFVIRNHSDWSNPYLPHHTSLCSFWILLRRALSLLEVTPFPKALGLLPHFGRWQSSSPPPFGLSTCPHDHFGTDLSPLNTTYRVQRICNSINIKTTPFWKAFRFIRILSWHIQACH